MRFLVPFHNSVLTTTSGMESIQQWLKGSRKVRFRSGRTYRLFKSRRGSIIVPEASWVNTYRPFILIQVKERDDSAEMIATFFAPGSLLLVVIGGPILVTLLARSEWGALVGTVLMLLAVHVISCGAFAYERSRALRDLAEIVSSAPPAASTQPR
jgi:hypothetical protein